MRLIPVAVAVAMLVAPVAGDAALHAGAKAPDFTTRGALAGKQFDLKLSNQLRKGPVVLYFFPAAFTPGCSLEARTFASNIAAFKKAGATVIGMSADPIDKLADFSTKDCASKFPVAVATPAVIAGYDVKLQPMANWPADVQLKAAGKTARTSYVIAPNGKIIYAHTDLLNAKSHVTNTLEAVRKWQLEHGK